MRPYYSTISKTPFYKEISNNIEQKKQTLIYDSTDEGMLILAEILRQDKGQVLLLVSDDIKASRLARYLSTYTDRVFHLKSKQVTLYGVEAYSREILNSRLPILARLVKGESMIVVSSVEAYANSLMKPEAFKKFIFEVKEDDHIDTDRLLETLISIGYKPVSYIEGKGQFSIRGGIVDLFSPMEDYPCRIELFDHEIDSMRLFDPKTQRSIEKVNQYEVIPAAEIVLSNNNMSQVIERINDSINRRLEEENHNSNEHHRAEHLKSMKERVEKAFLTGEYVYQTELYKPYISEELCYFGKYFKEKAISILFEPNQIRQSREDSYQDFIYKYTELYEDGQMLNEQTDIFDSYDGIIQSIKTDLSIILYNQSLKNNHGFSPESLIKWRNREAPRYFSKIEDLTKDIHQYQHKGYKVYLEISEKQKAERLIQELEHHDCQVQLTLKSEEALSGQALSIIGSIEKGVEFIDNKILIISEKDIFGTKSRPSKKRKKQKASKIDSFTDLKPGDYVVHEHHGIGIYKGIETINVKDIQKDYLAIHYRAGDKLYVPVDQMDLIQKYIGSENIRPKLNKMSGTDWQKAKAKAQKAIDDMADELIALYSERQSIKGFAYPEDNEWQKEFELAFEFQETDDQLRCIEEIKQDMMNEIPMDRLLCGDVGFGKTEVALRAVFKAVNSGKQAVILVPTTILAQQHYSNIIHRFKDYPIKVEMLSRFRTAGQQRKIISDLRMGLIDVVVGTHKLLGQEVKYKDLGLLVIDEEQRFGVKHKEKIKQFKSSIDVLTLSATPIPRTLNMAMVGIRDMSVIEEPPGERYPIQTFIMEKNEYLIKDAMIKECSRAGQVYYVYNRVKDIEEKAAKIKQLVPELRVAVAHGQMGERQLENIMIDFISHEYDVLVCTTIIETGMDIGNVNTIIIENADKLGLAQLYQLRGRVGRTNKTSFAYLMYEKNKSLSEIAEKRLKAIREFTEFGSGFKIAMRDLEIRGAGNLVGSQQSGHLAAIGYDLFVKMMERTMQQKHRSIEKPLTTETVIELGVEGFIPNRYIPDEEQKIEVYKKISAIESDEDADDVTEEVIDRFGDMPSQVYNLIQVSQIKHKSSQLGVIAIRQQGKYVNFEFEDTDRIQGKMIEKIMSHYKDQVKFDHTKKPMMKYTMIHTEQKDILSQLKSFVETIG